MQQDSGDTRGGATPIQMRFSDARARFVSRSGRTEVSLVFNTATRVIGVCLATLEPCDAND